MKIKIPLIVGLALSLFLIGGCATPGEYTKTGVSNRPERPEDCHFEIYTMAPKKEYEELGVIEFRAYKPKTISEVKNFSQKKVCRSGGNGLLLWETNGLGQYINATVIYVGDEN